MNKFVISLLIASCFVGAFSSPEPKENAKESKTPDELPTLTKGQTLVIKSENSKIYANEKILYEEDPKFKEGKLHIDLSKHYNLKVNGKKVFAQDPNQPIITKNPKIHAKNISQFEIKVDEQGQVTYVLKTSA